MADKTVPKGLLLPGKEFPVQVSHNGLLLYGWASLDQAQGNLKKWKLVVLPVTADMLKKDTQYEKYTTDKQALAAALSVSPSVLRSFQEGLDMNCQTASQSVSALAPKHAVAVHAVVAKMRQVGGVDLSPTITGRNLAISRLSDRTLAQLTHTHQPGNDRMLYDNLSRTSGMVAGLTPIVIDLNQLPGAAVIFATTQIPGSNGKAPTIQIIDRQYMLSQLPRILGPELSSSIVLAELGLVLGAAAHIVPSDRTSRAVEVLFSGADRRLSEI